MSNQHTGLPNTPEEIRAFIDMQFSSLQFGQENEQPHENDSYTLTAHDLISAFQWLEIDAPVSAEPCWSNRNTESLSGWINELGLLAIHHSRMPAWVRDAINTIHMGLIHHYAPVVAQPDLTKQTLDDVKAGIPARDAEIDSLRNELETLQAAQVQQPVSGADLHRDEEIKALDDAWKNEICHAVGEYTAAKIAWLRRAALAQQDAYKVDADPLQGAADWLVKDCGVKNIAELARRLSIGYNRATRLMEAARKERA